jgi:hypothetical protein
VDVLPFSEAQALVSSWRDNPPANEALHIALRAYTTFKGMARLESSSVDDVAEAVAAAGGTMMPLEMLPPDLAACLDAARNAAASKMVN